MLKSTIRITRKKRPITAQDKIPIQLILEVSATTSGVMLLATLTSPTLGRVIPEEEGSEDETSEEDDEDDEADDEDFEDEEEPPDEETEETLLLFGRCEELF